MKASVERLRWVLAGGAVLLVLVLGIFVGYGRYRALQNWRQVLTRSGIHITHETDGYTFSQSVKGRTIFTLHAAKAIQRGDGKWALHDAVMTLFGKTGNSVDHIYGSDFEYDEKTGVARALGEVLMDIEAPAAAGKSNAKPADRIIHVRTSGLVYVRKLAVAATDQEVEFRYANMQCFAKGAEFDTGENVLRLLSDVRVTGDVRGEPVMVRAAKADLDRQANTVVLAEPVAEMKGRTVRAATAVFDLRTDGSIDHARADGAVTLDAGTRHVVAQHMDGTFSSASEPQLAHLTGGVMLADSNPARPLQGRAQKADLSFNAAGAPTSIVAVGGADVDLSERRPGSPALARELKGDRIVVTLLPLAHTTRSQISEVRAVGSAMARGDSLAAMLSNSTSPALKSMQVFADDLRGVFDTKSKQAALQQVFGEGHTRLQQTAPAGESQTTTGDSLAVVFVSKSDVAKGPLLIESAVQKGHVTMHSVAAARSATTAAVVSDASADKASFEASSNQLTLTGQARFAQPEILLTATSIAVEQRLGDADARGDVLATVSNEPKQGVPTGQAAQSSAAQSSAAQSSAGQSSAGQSSAVQSSQPTHVSADHAHLAHASGLVEFFGTQGRPARLWQDASQVEASSLLFDQKKHTLSARAAGQGSVVHAIFASASKSTQFAPQTDSKKKQNAGQVLRVTSAAMDYADAGREATFTGGVHVEGLMGSAQAQRTVVFLQPLQSAVDGAKSAKSHEDPANPVGGSLERVVLTGDVRLDQPGRVGTGEELVYTAVDSSYILTGTAAKPPHIVDAQQGNVTGTTLLFRQGDNTIIVAGAPAEKAKTKGSRVRSETEVRQ